MTRDELIRRLIRAGELLVEGATPEEFARYFDPDRFRFHGPDAAESDYAGLLNYFAAIRAAFDDRSIRRGIMVVEADTIACQTWIKGTFNHEFAASPAGPLPPNGARITMDLINIFRFDPEGRLIEEFVHTDYRSLLRQLGAEGA